MSEKPLLQDASASDCLAVAGVRNHLGGVSERPLLRDVSASDCLAVVGVWNHLGDVNDRLLMLARLFLIAWLWQEYGIIWAA